MTSDNEIKRLKIFMANKTISECRRNKKSNDILKLITCPNQFSRVTIKDK